MKSLWNVYPIYDWKTEDIWIYHAKTNKLYNHLYDRMHQAGLSIHQQRICQPYGDDQRKGLWLFHIIEPETWSRIVARVTLRPPERMSDRACVDDICVRIE